MLEALGAFFEPEAWILARGAGGFRLFGPEHLVVLCLFCLLIAGLVARYRSLPAGLGRKDPRRRQLEVMATVPLVLLASRNIELIACGCYASIFWPLHICNFSEYFAFAYALHPTGRGGRRLGDLCFCWGLSGGIGALLFPGWSYCPIWSYVSLCGFAEHSLLVAIVLCSLAGHDMAPSPRRFWLPALLALAGGLFFRWFNAIFDTNFFFVTRPDDAGAPFAAVASVCGNPGYLVPYFLIVCAVWMLMYACWWLASGRKRTDLRPRV